MLHLLFGAASLHLQLVSADYEYGNEASHRGRNLVLDGVHVGASKNFRYRYSESQFLSNFLNFSDIEESWAMILYLSALPRFNDEANLKLMVEFLNMSHLLLSLFCWLLFFIYCFSSLAVRILLQLLTPVLLQNLMIDKLLQII